MKKSNHRSKKIAAALIISLIAGYMAYDGKDDKYFESKVVKLSSEKGMCSGEQIIAPSGEKYILSAGHCKGLADQYGEIKVTTEDGRALMRKIIAEDPESDLLLIEAFPGLDGLSISKREWRRGEHVRTYTHGSNLATHKTEGMLIDEKEAMALTSPASSKEEIAACESMPKQKYKELDLGFFSISGCFLQVQEIVMTASITPGSSGGMAVNDAGELMGVASMSDKTFGYIVRPSDIRKFLSNY